MVAAGVSLVASAGLLSLAVPRLIASLAVLPGSAAVGLLEAGSLPTEAGIKRAIVAQVDSLDALPQPLPHFNIAYLSAALAEASNLPEPDEEALLAVARHHLERALAMAPGHARAWFMLAGLRHNTGTDREAAARALALSFAADPHLPQLAPLRWPMSLVLEDRLDADARRQADAEFLTFFRTNPGEAARVALRSDRLPELRTLAARSDLDEQRLAAVLADFGVAGG
jgi:hypothetical protein